jgi:hypothetical protein
VRCGGLPGLWGVEDSGQELAVVDSSHGPDSGRVASGAHAPVRLETSSCADAGSAGGVVTQDMFRESVHGDREEDSVLALAGVHGFVGIVRRLIRFDGDLEDRCLATLEYLVPQLGWVAVSPTNMK